MVRGLSDISEKLLREPGQAPEDIAVSVSHIIKKGLDSASFMWYITYVGYAYEYININPIESMG
jgi:hypothetical protein